MRSRRFRVKEPRHLENLSPANCYLYSSTCLRTKPYSIMNNLGHDDLSLRPQKFIIFSTLKNASNEMALLT